MALETVELEVAFVETLLGALEVATVATLSQASRVEAMPQVRTQLLSSVKEFEAVKEVLSQKLRGVPSLRRYK